MPRPILAPWSEGALVCRRRYQFGAFCPVFRTHGCRYGHDGSGLAPDDPCVHSTYSCGANEVWSYGNDTQVILEKYIRLRHDLKPYIAEPVCVDKRAQPSERPDDAFAM